MAGKVVFGSFGDGKRKPPKATRTHYGFRTRTSRRGAYAAGLRGRPVKKFSQPSDRLAYGMGSDQGANRQIHEGPHGSLRQYLLRHRVRNPSLPPASWVINKHFNDQAKAKRAGFHVIGTKGGPGPTAATKKHWKQSRNYQKSLASSKMPAPKASGPIPFRSGKNVGSFKGRRGQWKKGKGGRFTGST